MHRHSARLKLRCGALTVAAGLLVWTPPTAADGEAHNLPAPRLDSDVSLEWSLAHRRSRRKMAETPLSPAQLGQLLWAGQGITRKAGGFRTAPSAGARYPLRVYLLTADGVFVYRPRGHKLVRVQRQDVRTRLWKHVYARPWLRGAPAIFAIAADYRITEAKYGRKARRFVHIEVGHVGQNLLLQATAMGLRCVGIGAFHDSRSKATLALPKHEELIYLIAVGKPI